MSAPRILAILTLRNEGAFLLDWLAHHRAAGITDFLVFTNDCEDGTDAMLDRLADMGWLTHESNPGPHTEGPQWAALKRADAHPLRAAADWLLTIDIDEYVNVHVGDRTLPALIAAAPEANALPLTWRMFGNCGVVGYRDAPVTEQFTRAAPPALHWPWRALLFKTLFRNDGTYRKLGVHRPRSPDRDRVDAAVWIDGSGRRLPPALARRGIVSPPGIDSHGHVQLNHYALGAAESYLLKCDRGRANRGASGFDMGYWVERNFCTEEDRSILALAPRVAPIRAALGADPTLTRLHAAAVAWRHDRVARLMVDESWRALFGRLLMTPPARCLDARTAAMIRRHGNRRPAER